MPRLPKPLKCGDEFLPQGYLPLKGTSSISLGGVQLYVHANDLFIRKVPDFYQPILRRERCRAEPGLPGARSSRMAELGSRKDHAMRIAEMNAGARGSSSPRESQGVCHGA